MEMFRTLVSNISSKIAETRHQQTVVSLAESANHEHVRLMAGLSQEAALALQRQASEALARSESMERNKALQRLSEMAHNAKISQLEQAMELQENKHRQMFERQELEKERAIAQALREANEAATIANAVAAPVPNFGEHYFN